jgi:DNA-binding beta-propeller fold protein YncE
MMRPVSMVIVLLLAAVGGSAVAATPPVAYTISKTVPLGGPDKWDYLAFEAATGRVYVSHGSETTVVDGRTGSLVGRITGGSGEHGISVVSALGRGYADSAAPPLAIVFDLNTLKTVATVPVAADPDPIVFDPASGHAFVISGDARAATVIDATHNTVLATIALGGKPEFPVVDGAGTLFVNIAETREIVRIDTKTNAIEARYAIPACESPHGLAIDTETRRLFSGCVNSRLMVVDADSGTLVTSLPIGKGSDAIAFDAKHHRVLSSNGEGTLTVIAEQGADSFAVLGDIPTAPGAKTLALDPDSGRVFLITGDVATTTPGAEGRAPRFTYKPGSAKLLFLDPSP